MYGEALDLDLARRQLRTSAGTFVGDRIVDRCAGARCGFARRLGLRVGDARLRTWAGPSAHGGAAYGSSRPTNPETSPSRASRAVGCGSSPFGEGVASVGVVGTPQSPLTGTAEARLPTAGIAASPDATARLEGAERILPYRSLPGLSPQAPRPFTATASRSAATRRPSSTPCSALGCSWGFEARVGSARRVRSTEATCPRGRPPIARASRSFAR